MVGGGGVRPPNITCLLHNMDLSGVCVLADISAIYSIVNLYVNFQNGSSLAVNQKLQLLYMRKGKYNTWFVVGNFVNFQLNVNEIIIRFEVFTNTCLIHFDKRLTYLFRHLKTKLVGYSILIVFYLFPVLFLYLIVVLNKQTKAEPLPNFCWPNGHTFTQFGNFYQLFCI